MVLTVESFHPCLPMLPNWFRSFPGYNPALLPQELALWNSSALNLPALGNVPHAQGYDLQPVGNPLHMSHSGTIFDPTRPQPVPVHMQMLSNQTQSIPLASSTSAPSQSSENHQQYLDQIRDELRNSLTDHITKELQQSFQENFPKQPPSHPPPVLPAPLPPTTSPTEAPSPPVPNPPPPQPLPPSQRDPTPPAPSNPPPALPTSSTSKPKSRIPRSPLLRSRRPNPVHQSSRRRRRRSRSRSSRPRHRRRCSSSRSRTRTRLPPRSTHPKSPTNFPRSTPISLKCNPQSRQASPTPPQPTAFSSSTPRQPPPTTVYSQPWKSWWNRYPTKSSSWDHNYNSDENWGHRRPSDGPSKPSSPSAPAPSLHDDPGQDELPLSDLKGAKDDDWPTLVKWALYHPERVKAGNELRDHEKPILKTTYDGKKAAAFKQRCRQLAPDIPDKNMKHLIRTLAASDAFDHLVLDELKVLDASSVNKKVLIAPLPTLPRFEEKPAFKGSASNTWGMLHGSGILAAQLIVAEGQLRPADWEINPRDFSKCSLPSFGVFGIGRQMARDAQSIEDYHLIELFNAALKKGKGQQDILTGAIYKGAIEHTALKAGGTEDAQMTVASKGAVTTSEKYFVAHAKHTTVKFVSSAWQYLEPYSENEHLSTAREDPYSSGSHKFRYNQYDDTLPDYDP